MIREPPGGNPLTMPPSTSACPFPLYSRIHRVCSGLSLPWKNVPSNFPLIWNLRASRRMIGKFFKIIPSTKTFLFRSRIVKNPLKIPKYQRNHVPPFFFLHNTLPNNRNRSNENYSQTIYDNIHLYKKKEKEKKITKLILQTPFQPLIFLTTSSQATFRAQESRWSKAHLTYICQWQKKK